jgi:Ca-activated chloride channel family protein
VGLDYNEDLMTKIADQGGGRYHFIKDTEAIAGVLNDEFTGLVATVASQVAIDVGTAPGVRLVKVFGYPTFEEGGRTFIRVGSIGSAQTREIVARFEYDRPLGEVGALATLAQVKVGFKDVASGGSGSAEAAVAVSVLGDDAAIAATENTEVTIRVSEVEAADKLEVAARAVEQGNFEGAGAALDDSIQQLRKTNAARPSKRLEARIQEMEAAKDGLSAAEESPSGRASYVKGNKASSYNLKK